MASSRLDLDGMEESSKRLVFWFLEIHKTKSHVTNSHQLVLKHHKSQIPITRSLRNKSQMPGNRMVWGIYIKEHVVIASVDCGKIKMRLWVEKIVRCNGINI